MHPTASRGHIAEVHRHSSVGSPFPNPPPLLLLPTSLAADQLRRRFPRWAPPSDEYLHPPPPAFEPTGSGRLTRRGRSLPLPASIKSTAAARLGSSSPQISAPAVSLLVRSSPINTEFPIRAATMRLSSRAIFHLVRTTATTASDASSMRAVLSVGHALRERRRFTEDDVAAYAAVSGDHNPVHLDDAVARELGGFQRGRVVHGMLVASLFPSIIAASFPGAVYASQTLKFAAAVYVGDEVVARVQALNIRTTGAMNSSTASRYIVKFATKCFMDEEEGSVAIEGEAMTVLPTLELSSQSTSKQ